uniref:Uncharacterized protein n=1 Tax=Rhipicephalus microplus TaxID=6941 RepID=A0A6G5AGX3_RHIMP
MEWFDSYSCAACMLCLQVCNRHSACPFDHNFLKKSTIQICILNFFLLLLVHIRNLYESLLCIFSHLCFHYWLLFCFLILLLHLRVRVSLIYNIYLSSNQEFVQCC